MKWPDAAVIITLIIGFSAMVMTCAITGVFK